VAVTLFLLTSWDLLLWDATSEAFRSVPEAERFFYDAARGSHVLALLACAVLLWLRRADSRPRGGLQPAAMAVGVALLLAALGLRIWSVHTGARELGLIALALLLVGAGTVLGGRSGAVRAAGLAAVLVVGMPIPVPWLTAFIHPMQMLTASGVSWLLSLIGQEHVLLGEQIRIEGFVFYVIEGCAGVSTLQSLALAGVIYLHFLYRRPSQVIGLAVSIPLLAVAVNQIRVLTIVLFPSSETATDHTLQGLVMTVVGVIAIALFDLLLARLETPVEVPPVVDTEVPPASGSDRGCAAVEGVIVLAALVFASAFLWVPTWSPPVDSLPRAASLPTRIAGYRAVRTLQPDRQYLGSVRWSDQVHRIYAPIEEPSEGEPKRPPIELLILVDDHRERAHDLGSDKVWRAGPGYRLLSSSPQPGEGGDSARQLAELVRVGGRERVLHWRVGRAPGFWARLVAGLGVEQSVWGPAGAELAVRLSIAGEAEDLAARRQLRAFADAVDRAIRDRNLTGVAEAAGSGPDPAAD
jgi:exosortase/archaeosortase family protein